MKDKLKTFLVSVLDTKEYTAEIKAKTLEQALDIAQKMDEADLWDKPGEVLQQSTEITGAWLI